MKNNFSIAIIGLGYVGLPLTIEFAKKYNVIGFDINQDRVAELKLNQDRTKEVTSLELENCKALFTCDINELKKCNIYIVSVPTPIKADSTPDLRPLKSATEMIGKLLNVNDIVIYESTVYPGCTEEECVPILEEESKLKFNYDFHCGYSPERINPGDKINTLTKIKKVTSGSNKETALIVDKLYDSIITAGTYLASSIKVAEASKAIENAQRDLNISFMNELALIFDRIGIDTNDVLEAAGTKWNFLKYKPGLVGGHCISVDPYYLVYKAEMLGYCPEVILSGRRLNSEMPVFICSKIVKLMIKKKIKIENAKALILGVSFKENCPDIRNTKIVDLYYGLKEYKIDVDIFDPIVSKEEMQKEYKIDIINDKINSKYDVIVLAVPHEFFKKIDYSKYLADKSVLFDIKSILPKEKSDARL